jgi:hypothetical protein
MSLENIVPYRNRISSRIDVIRKNGIASCLRFYAKGNLGTCSIIPHVRVKNEQKYILRSVLLISCSKHGYKDMRLKHLSLD